MKKEIKQGRGQLTERIKERSKILLGYEISETELRLMAYLQYVMVNEQRLDPNKISQEEREIISKYKGKEFIEGGINGMTITEEFWTIICQILWLGYVDLIN